MANLLPKYVQDILDERGVKWGKSDFDTLSEILQAHETVRRHASGDWSEELQEISDALDEKAGAYPLDLLLDGPPYHMFRRIEDAAENDEPDSIKADARALLTYLDAMHEIALKIKTAADQLPD